MALQIVLPSVPRLGNNATPDQIATALGQWTQQAERAIRKIADAVSAIEAGSGVSSGSWSSIRMTPSPMAHLGGETVTFKGSGFSSWTSLTITSEYPGLLSFSSVTVVDDATITATTSASGEYSGAFVLLFKNSGVEVARIPVTSL